MALSFIGKPISLISHSDVRYRGILAGIDPQASTIQLSNVFSMGTESRRPPEQFIPPVQEPYTYIIFRASEVKDLAVDEPTPRRSVHDDPAVLGASAPMAQGSFGYTGTGQPSQSQSSPQARQRQAYPPQQASTQIAAPQATAATPAQNGTAAAQPPAADANKSGRNSAVNSATASMETVERALGDLRVTEPAHAHPQHASNHHPRGGHGGRRGGRHQEAKTGGIAVPTTDFDFQSSNAKFDKTGLGSNARSTPKSPEVNGEAEEKAEGEEKEKQTKDKAESEPAYNPKKSFFDSLSSGSNAPDSHVRGRGGRRGVNGRNRREEERERNVATFGEPGGIGLMGPGAYVGGWGGYGRRGGGRGRRGGAVVGTRG